MARGRLPRRRDRGGESIPESGQNSARLATAGVALALLALVGAYGAVSAVRWQGPAAGLAGASVVILAAALLQRRTPAVPAAVLLAGSAYGVAVVGREPAFDSTSVVVATLLLLVSELSFWSVELAAPVRYEPPILTRRLAFVAALGLLALVSAGVVAAAAAQDAERSLLLEGLGVAAAVAVTALFARLARER